ncbi:MAG: hypothetical protein AAGC49_06385 [Brevundimonas sp.]
MSFRPVAQRAAIAAALGGALAVGLVAPASAAPVVTVTTSQHAATSVKTKITTAPKAVSVVTGKSATFKVRAKGTKLTYQWYVRKPGTAKYVKISGAKKSSYTVVARAKLDGGRYRVAVKGARGSVTSASAPLVVFTRPTISRQPADKQVTSGTKTTFSVSAKGHGLSYTWQRQNQDSQSWTTVGHASTYSVTAKSRLHGAVVRVVVSNKAGKVTSNYATLTVNSTVADPYAPQLFGTAGEWLVSADKSVLDANTAVAAASPANPAAPAGSAYVTTTIVACNLPAMFGGSGPASANELVIRLRGTDGKLYTTSGVVLPAVPADVVEDFGDMDDSGCFLFTVGALAPTSVIAGSTWSVTGPAGDFLPKSTQYWATA